MSRINTIIQKLRINAATGLLILLALLLTGCGASTASTASTDSTAESGDSNSVGTLTVVATYSILQDWVTNVAGDLADEKVEIVTLVGSGGDAHTYEPTPADSVALTRATLIFENGVEFEGWLEDLYDASGSSAKRVVVAEDLVLLHMGEGDHEEGEHEEDEHEEDEHEEDEHSEHEHGEFDPHVWQDVTNAIAMVEVIRDELIEADPENATIYAANADAYLDELAELDAWVMEQIASVPEEKRKLVTVHDTFRYFAERYGLEVIGTALGTSSTEAGDPSARQMVDLIELIQAEAVPALFVENVSNPELIERIAQETGVAIGGSLYTDALGEQGSEGDSYIAMIRHNVEMLVEALR